MNFAPADQIARAVLYEGYVLYPYRASAIKNRQRFNFGVLSPRGSETLDPHLKGVFQAECLIAAPAPRPAPTEIELRVRCLHLRTRQLCRPVGLGLAEVRGAAGETPELEPVDAVVIDGQTFATWDEAEEREVVVAGVKLDNLTRAPLEHPFEFAEQQQREVLRNRAGEIAGLALRSAAALRGKIELSARPIAPHGWSLRIVVQNETLGVSAAPETSNRGVPMRDARQENLRRSLISAHAVAGVEHGSFISLLEPPAAWQSLAAECQNDGVWPVLIGAPGRTDLLLASPIILYDYPAIAPESPGDLFDGTENDELLTLRILTLTEAEKAEARGLDDRTRQMLERTESLPEEFLLKMHGAIRGLRRVGGGHEPV
ncbi:MAG TPA: hypothetical protein VFE24_06180 [Pirellulales bacterium]|jgi:hydrogenase maturation protease|nr:hypothetical protein [Pirellulales bacterium]